MKKSDLIEASKAARFNREALEKCNICGCYYCIKIFSPTEITEWVFEDCEADLVTAICPCCGIDAVIPENSGFPLTQEFLDSMHRWWFE